MFCDVILSFKLAQADWKDFVKFSNV